MRIVLGNATLASYPQGGGHWMVSLQYLLGLRDLGHDVLHLELLHSTGNADRDQQRIGTFFECFDRYGCRDNCALLLFRCGTRGHDVGRAEAFGRSKAEIEEFVRSSDLLWNDCGSVSPPLLDKFRHRVYLDGDPGHTHVSALSVDMAFNLHETLLTVGKKINDEDCGAPTSGRRWSTFTWFAYLPLWDVAPAPSSRAPFTSITHWNWGELELDQQVLSLSKRDAYLRYVELPKRSGRQFELAVSLEKEDDPTNDRQRLEEHGWNVVDPWELVATPAAYQSYIARSRAEISCPKPVYRQLNTGWFSDRSVCFLASGRPVLAEDTGFSDFLPTGDGIIAFRDMEQALAGVSKIDANYAQQCRAARALAEDVFDSRRCLASMLEVCG